MKAQLHKPALIALMLLATVPAHAITYQFSNLFLNGTLLSSYLATRSTWRSRSPSTASRIKLRTYWLTGRRSDAAAASSAARNAGSIRTPSCSVLLACFAISAAYLLDGV
jgi:hypothetical protein